MIDITKMRLLPLWMWIALSSCRTLFRRIVLLLVNSKLGGVLFSTVYLKLASFAAVQAMYCRIFYQQKLPNTHCFANTCNGLLYSDIIMFSVAIS